MSLIYRGTSSDDVHFNVTERRVYNAPAFDVTGIEVPGRSGDILNSQERFKNKSIVYTGFIRSSDFPGDTTWERLSRGLRTIKAWVCGDAGKYHDLTDDYDPGFVRRAFVSGETAISEVLDRPDGATITITFMAEPFMYEESDPIELPETGTASGAIASFEGVAAPLQSLKFNIEPKQDLHGYSYPWPAGGGKNLINFPDIAQTTSNDVTYSMSGGVLSINGTATGSVVIYPTQAARAAATYTMSAQLLSGSMSGTNSSFSVYSTGSTRRLLTFGNTGVTTKTTFTGDIVAANAGIVINSGAIFTNAKIAFQVEAGSDMTAFAPYSNISPISGWASVNGKHSGADTSDYTPITFTLGQTVYGGYVDAIAGKCYARPYYSSYSGQTLVGPWISSHDKYVSGGTPTTGAQVVDMGGAVTEISVTAQQVSSLLGQNNIWCNTGDTEVVYVEPTENPTEWPSKPRLEMTMAGAGTLTVNGKTWSIGSYTGTLICDSEIMDWYDASNLKNSLVSGDGFPEFQPGENVITYTGGITKVVAKPRWRTL